MIYLAADHRGVEIKEKIKQWLAEWGCAHEDLGAFECNLEDDYPDFVAKAAEKVAADPDNSKAIVLGGSGQGEAMVANRYKGVRAAVFYGGDKEVVRLTRDHNNANILSIGTFFLNEDEIKELIKLWLNTPFSGEARHVRRLAKF